MQGYRTIISLIFFQFLTTALAGRISSIDLAWDFTLFSSYFIAMIAVIGWFMETSNKKTKLKIILLFEILYLFTEVISFPLLYLNISFLIEWIRAITLSIWFGYIIFRNGKACEAELNNKDIFAIRSKPTGFQDYFLSLLDKYELGSYGLYYNGSYYHYRHGKMVKDSLRILKAQKDRFVVIKSKKYNQKIIDKIEKLVGSKWTIISNCYTKIRPLLKENDREK